MEFGRVSVIIPALNEERGIGNVIARLRVLGLSSIIVGDNGSTDATAQVARDAGALVVAAPQRGYGAACAAALAYVPVETDWVLFVDADAGTELDALPKMLATAGDNDFVLGDRNASVEARRSLTPVQRFGNRLATSLMELVYGHRYGDLGPLRIIRREALDRIGMRDRGFGWTAEMQARAIECGLRIAEIDLPSGGREHGKSKISGTIRGSWRAGRAILATLALCWVQRISRMWSGPRAQRTLIPIAALLIVGGAIGMMPFGDFKQIPARVFPFLTAAAVMSAGYFAAFGIRRIPIAIFWAIAISSRFVLLPMVPGDDIWRYLWDGLVQWHGFNPYLAAPNDRALTVLHPPWFELMNNRDATTLYPPLALLAFKLLSFSGTHVLVFKLAFVAADLMTCRVLARAFGETRAMAYAWSPLVIYSFAGGGHYDSLFILPMTAALCVVGSDESRRTAFFHGISAAIKWVTLPIAFHEVRTALVRARWRLAVVCAVLGIVPLIFGCVWFFDAFATGRFYPQHFVTFARSAELIPFYFEFPHPLWAHNTLVRVALLGIAGGTLLLATSRRVQFAERWLFILICLSPLVHAWYFVWLAPFAVLTRNLGVIAASACGFVYFMLHWHVAQLNGEWRLEPWEHALFWFPLVAGYGLSLFLRLPRDEPLHVGAKEA
jgi:hypothetical protein